MPKSLHLAAPAALLAICACSASSTQDGCKSAGPQAIAGPPQSAAKRAAVQLGGSAANTKGNVTYGWRLDAPAGSSAALSSSSAAGPSFTPDVSGEYVATLFVRDACGASAPATTVVTVANHAPLASAGPDRNAMPGDTVTLDGRGSSDADQDALQYRWTLASRPAGSTASLSSATAASPTFTPDAYGTYLAILVVSDGEDASQPVEVVVQAGVTGPNGTCAPAPAPIASAGPDQSLPPYSNATLDGTASVSGRPGAPAFAWTLTSAPGGSHASIDQLHAARPMLVGIDKPGTYAVQLVVNDGCVDSAPATVRITRPNSVPWVYAYGAYQSVPVLWPFTLQGNASDNDNEPLTIRWKVVSAPAGSTATIADPTLLVTTFTPDIEGTYLFSLVASDAVSSSNPAQVTYTVVNMPPVAKMGPDQSASAGTLVTLDGSGSTDPSHRALTFAWTLQPPLTSKAVLSSNSEVKPTFTADVTGVYRVQLTVSAGGVSSQTSGSVGVWPGVARLPHRVIDAAYSGLLERVVTVAADPNALYLLDPRAPAETTVPLSLVPTSVAVDSAGHFAAVGHANAISYVDLQAAAVVRVLSVQGTVASVTLGDDGFAFAFLGVPAGDHVRMLAVPVAGGPPSLVISGLIGAGFGRFRSANSVLYVATNAGYYTSAGVEEYSMGGGNPALVTVPAGAYLSSCGNLWLSQSASRLFTRCGSVLRASSSAPDDLAAAGTLSRASNVNLLLRHLSDSGAAGEISAIASPDVPIFYPPSDDQTLRRWSADGLTLRDSVLFPAETIGTTPFRWQGRFVFYRSDGSERYLVLQLDPAAGALEDFGFAVF